MKQQDLLVGSSAGSPPHSDKPAAGAERRKGVRFAVSASADMLEVRTRARLVGRASDLGAGGCYIDTVMPFPVGTSMVLNLTSESHTVHATANVIYAHTGMGMGLAFAEMTPTQRANLAAWLRELSGEPPKAAPPAKGSAPFLQDAAIQEAVTGSEGASQLEALQELVSMLEKKGVLTEAEVKLLRDKMTE